MDVYINLSLTHFLLFFFIFFLFILCLSFPFTNIMILMFIVVGFTIVHASPFTSFLCFPSFVFVLLSKLKLPKRNQTSLFASLHAYKCIPTIICINSQCMKNLPLSFPRLELLLYFQVVAPKQTKSGIHNSFPHYTGLVNTSLVPDV